MLAATAYGVHGQGRARIDHANPVNGLLIGSDHCQPAIHAQPPWLKIATGDAGEAGPGRHEVGSGSERFGQ